jgi:predicted transcriptional regulator
MESEQNQPDRGDLLDMTVAITVALVTGNRVAATALPDTIRSIYDSLRRASEPAFEPEPQTPAVRVSRSVTDEYIVCLECGAKLRTLKRHLATRHSMTVERYRAKWGLPANYPLVAPAYAAIRSELAKASGLGTAPTSRGRRRRNAA